MPGETDHPSAARRGLGHTPFAALKAKLGSAATPGPTPATPQAPAASDGRVTVRRERSGRAGKTVTLAEGPGLAGRDLAALARDAAKALGAGARVENDALAVQGDQAERLVEWLSARGFPSVARGN